MCDARCVDCQGIATSCTSCKPGLFKNPLTGECDTSCPDSYYAATTAASTSSSCLRCSSSCKKCSSL
jgi:hypothetical protein